MLSKREDSTLKCPYITVLQLPSSLCVKARRTFCVKECQVGGFLAVNLGGTAGQPVPFLWDRLFILCAEARSPQKNDIRIGTTIGHKVPVMVVR